MASDHPFLNHRAKLLGLDRQTWIKSIFATASAVTILILLTIIGSLLQEGIDFVPTNHHRLQVQRASGGEFNDQIRADLERHTRLSSDVSVAISREQASRFQLETDLRQASFAAFNTFEDVVGKRRERLENARKSGRAGEIATLEREIGEVGERWLRGNAIERAVAESASADEDALHLPYASWTLGADALSRLAGLTLEPGLHRFLWLRDPRAVRRLSAAAPAPAPANPRATPAAPAPPPPPAAVLTLGSLTLIEADRVEQLLGDDYRHGENCPVWIWVGPPRQGVAPAATEARLWLWGERGAARAELDRASGLTASEPGTLRSGLVDALRSWATSDARRPALLDGLDADRTEAARRVGADFRQDQDLLRRLGESVGLLEDTEKLLRAHILETYSATIAYSSARDQMDSLLEGTARGAESGDLAAAHDNAAKAARQRLVPVNFDGRIQLIYDLVRGIDPTALAAALAERAKVSTRIGLPAAEDTGATVAKPAEAFAEAVGERLPGKPASIAAIYADARQRIEALRPRLLRDLDSLSGRQRELAADPAWAAALAAPVDADVPAEERPRALADALEQAFAARDATQVHALSGRLADAVGELRPAPGLDDPKTLAARILDLAPLSPLSEEGAIERTKTLEDSCSALLTTLEKSPRALAAWRHDKPVSWLGSAWSFFTGKRWITNTPWFEFYGMRPLFVGSLLIALTAILICVPFSVGAAIFVNKFSGKFEQGFIKPAIEFIQALPSVVLGFIGIAVLGSLMQDASGNPLLSWLPGFPIENRLNALLAGVLLALMAIPTVFTLAEDAINNVPRSLLEASESLGASRVQTVFRVIVPTALSGIVAAVLLGFGRVIGETMVVLLVAGGVLSLPDFAKGLGIVTEPTHTMTGIIAQELPEVSKGSEHWAALFMIGVVLFCLSLAINAASRWVVQRFKAEL